LQHHRFGGLGCSCTCQKQILKKWASFGILHLSISNTVIIFYALTCCATTITTIIPTIVTHAAREQHRYCTCDVWGSHGSARHGPSGGGRRSTGRCYVRSRGKNIHTCTWIVPCARKLLRIKLQKQMRLINSPKLE
jgi:hypothetical protein